MKKSKILSLLFCASALTLAGCNGGGDTSSAPEGSTSAPSTSEPSTSVEPVVADWSDEIKADMKSVLDGTVLPYVSGSWKASKEGGMLVLKSRDAELATAKEAFDAANYKLEAEEPETAVAYTTRTSKGTVTVIIQKTTGSYKLQVNAMFEEEPEDYWGFMDKQIMMSYLGDYLPYVSDEWAVTLQQDLFGNSWVIAVASTLSVDDVKAAYEEDYLVALDDEGDPKFTSVDPVEANYYLNGYIFTGSSSGKTTVQAITSTTQLVGRDVKISSSAEYGVHTGDEVTITYSAADYYDSDDVTISYDHEEEVEVVSQSEGTLTVRITAAEGEKVAFTVSAEKGKAKAEATVEVEVVSADVKLDWLPAEKTAMNENFGGQLPFLGPNWTVTEDGTVSTTEKDGARAEAKLAEAFLKYTVATEEATINTYILNSSYDAVLFLAVSETEDGTSVNVVSYGDNYSEWGSEDVAVMSENLGEGVVLPIVKGAYSPWSVTSTGDIMTYAFNVSAEDYVNAAVAAGYELDEDGSGQGYYSLSKAVSETKTIYVDVYDYANYNNTPVRIHAHAEEVIPSEDFPVDAVMEYLRAELGEEYETTLVTEIPGVPEGVTFTFLFNADTVTVQFSRELTAEEQTAVVTAYNNALYEAGWHEYDESFTDSPDELFYVYVGFMNASSLIIYFAFN